MLKREIEYTDYNDEPQKKTFFFNLTRSEIAKIELSAKGGIKRKIEKFVDDEDGENIIKFFEDILALAYGEKSVDGRFVKSPELSKAFSETLAYDQLFMELITDPSKAAVFINAIIPQVAELPKTN